jgi:hydroxylamine dehydrogenase
MENKGKYGHNVVRKSRWANYPGAGGIAKNITSEWSEKRKEAWLETCGECHSERFARSYFDMIDKATLAGVAKFDEAAEVVAKLYEDGLLTGQKTNRPAPPKPKKDDGAAQFYQLMWAKGNNPSTPELRLLEMGENELARLHVSVAHVDYGGWTYTTGWEQLLQKYSEIMEADTVLRDKAALLKRVAALESKSTALSFPFELDSTGKKITLGGLGGGMLLAGTVGLFGWRRRRGVEAVTDTRDDT